MKLSASQRAVEHQPRPYTLTDALVLFCMAGDPALGLEVDAPDRSRLLRFHAAVKARTNREKAEGRRMSVAEAVFVVAGGEDLVRKIAAESGHAVAVEYVLDHCEAAS